MVPLTNASGPLEGVAHIIQVALTPVFLLAGLANLLAVFSTRLGRVADKIDRLSEEIEIAVDHDAVRLSAQLTYLVRRSAMLDIAVVLGSIAGGATCASVLVLLMDFIWNASIMLTVFALFGAAVLFTLGALLAFVAEMLMAGRGLRAQARVAREIGGSR